MADRKLTLALIGCGDRGMNVYADIIKNKYCDKMEIVAAADPDAGRLGKIRDMFDIPDDMLFRNGDELLEKGKIADAVMICTLDRQHYMYALPALKLGYHILLEKPVSPSLSECEEIEKEATSRGLHVVVCHVLRYTAFYKKIKEFIDSGKIGNVVSIQAIEPVAYWHQAHSFVRGNWRNSAETSPMILQKCCHDMDLFFWLTGRKCEKVSSFGSLTEFRPENAPEGSALRCMDCKYVDTCPYSAKTYYLGQLKNGNVYWPVNVVCTDPAEDTLTEALKTGPYGRCVYHCDNDVVDHQVVNLLLEGGITVDFTMCAFTKESSRRIIVMGTKGELRGDFNNNKIEIYPFNAPDETFDVNTVSADFSFHGGGDAGLIGDFFELIKNGNYSDSITDIEMSLQSHYAALAAEKSRLNGGEPITIKG